MSLNKVQLIGNLGCDPDYRCTPSGTPVATFRMATTERWTDKESREKQSATEWHNILAWRNVADICNQLLNAGDLVYVEGKNKTRSYEKEGVEHYITEVEITKVDLLKKKEKNGEDED